MPSQKALPDRIADLKTQKEKLAARLIALEAKAKQQDRKRDAHRKIVVGGAVLAAIETNTDLAEMVRLLLDTGVTRPTDREVIGDLLPTDAAAAKRATASQPPHTSA